jgi:hypothetical protein
MLIAARLEENIYQISVLVDGPPGKFIDST